LPVSCGDGEWVKTDNAPMLNGFFAPFEIEIEDGMMTSGEFDIYLRGRK
jgi:hypothetical protein